MKIKKIKLQHHPFFGDAEFDFTDSSGRIMDNVVLAGENGCGKTQLLNIIFDFTTMPTRGDVRNELRIFSVILTSQEVTQINENLEDNSKLVSPTGEMEITIDFTKQSGYWSRLRVQYQSISDTGDIVTKTIDSSRLFANVDIKAVFKSIFSTVEINYNPNDTSTVTAKEVDEDVHESVKSGKDLASEIQQLLIDIQSNDATDLQTWVDQHAGIAPPNEVKHVRINRFKNAFSNVFNNLNISRIITQENKKKVLFDKQGSEVDIASLSSGEKQIVFRGAFLLRNQQSIKGCVALIDEPEISLHPIWQAKIFEYYRHLFTEMDGTQTSQIFFATHSQYVLRSALENRANTLIVLLKHIGTSIQINKITAPLVLPTVTSAELNYVAFDIVSNDYHIELYGHLQNKVAASLGKSECWLTECDTYITQQTDYNPTLHRKPSAHITPNRTTNYETLSTYIRNAIDHPDASRTFTQQELRTSIELLIKLCR